MNWTLIESIKAALNPQLWSEKTLFGPKRLQIGAEDHFQIPIIKQVQNLR
jgi:hypothetical protein